MKKKYYFLFAGILAIHLLLLVNLKFTAWPEMSLWPYLMIKGWLPYRDIAIAHTPLMIFDLALFYKFFGTGVLQLKIFTWVVILLADVLVFAVAKKLWGKKTAFISLFFYSFILLFYDGNGLWFDFYMGVLAFCSFYLVREKKWFWAGIFWALAFLSKQTAVWFLIPIAAEMTEADKLIVRRPLKGNPCKVVGSFIGGSLIIFGFFFILLSVFHLLPDFWNWAVKFGIFVLPRASGQVQLPSFRTLTMAFFPFLIFIPLLFNQKSKSFNLALWALAGVLGAYPRFEYFHFQPALPYLALALGITILGVKKNWIKKVLIIYLIGSGVLFAIFLTKNFGRATRFYEPEVQEVVNYVRQNSQPGEKILVMNWWDNVYAFTDTLPAIDPWVPQLSWYQELPGVQKEEVNDLRETEPRLVIYSPYTELGLSSYVPKQIYNYVMENYHLAKILDGVEILVPN